MVATSVWRAGALTATLCAIAFVAYHPTLPAREDFGITGDGPLVRTNVRAISIASRSSAERAGIRPGDRIAYPTWPLDFARAAFPAPGDRVTLTVNDRRRVTLIAARPPPAGIPWWITAVRLAFLLVAGLLAWRRPADRAARALFTFLLCFGIAIALDSGSLPWPLASFMLMQVFISIFFVAGIAAIAVFAALFPSDDARPVPRLLARAAVGIAILFALADVGFNLVPRNNAIVRAALPLSFSCFALEVALVIATFVVAYRQGPSEERERRRWVSLMLGATVAVIFVDAALQTALGYHQLIDELTTIPIMALPFALAYVILRHRVIDVGFVLNRAAVYTLVSAIIVGIFVVVETLASTYVEQNNRITSISVTIAVALVVGFSVRYIHDRVDRFVDAVLFRQRHEAEAAIRAFAHDASYITDTAVLLRRSAQTIMRYAGASAAGIWLYREPNRYCNLESSVEPARDVDENDPAIVAMRARGIVVELPQTESRLRGELAFPMIVRGELLGAVVCGRKRDGESYAPDERDALALLATSLGHALDTIEVRQLRSRLEELTAARALPR